MDEDRRKISTDNDNKHKLSRKENKIQVLKLKEKKRLIKGMEK